MDEVNGFRCQCASGFTGVLCEARISMCGQSQPCLHGGTCTDQINSFECDCAPGWSGQLCEIQMDPCASQPCNHNATCLSRSSSHFECVCPPNFIGTTCATPLNFCITQPCQNGGSCINGVTSYSCRCEAGFTGESCQHEVGTAQPAQTLVVNESSLLPLQISLILCLGVGIPLVLIILVLIFLLYRRQRNIRHNNHHNRAQHETGVTTGACDVDWDNLQNTEIAGRMNNSCTPSTSQPATTTIVTHEAMTSSRALKDKQLDDCDVSADVTAQARQPSQFGGRNSKNILNINNLNSSANCEKQTNKDGCNFGQKHRSYVKPDNVTGGHLDRCVHSFF